MKSYYLCYKESKIYGTPPQIKFVTTNYEKANDFQKQKDENSEYGSYRYRFMEVTFK